MKRIKKTATLTGVNVVGLILLIALMIGLGGVVSAQEKTINGAGASFPYPVYSRWAYKYHQLKGVKIHYQSIGSGGGISQIKAKTIDFGGTDAPLKKDELDKYGLLQFPMVTGGVVPVINVKGIEKGKLHLTRQILADIFLGKIVRWNDPAIKKVNPGVKLPRLDITVVHRSDGSGTTWIFTNYLCKISNKWKEKAGSGKAVNWPTGVGGKGNEGVSAYVQRINGSIGYVEFAYALTNDLTYVTLENREGNFVTPTIETFQSAAANARWDDAPGFYMVLTDQPGKNSWPITGATFILMYKDQKDRKKAKAMLSFFDWCYRHGADMAEKLHYIPMPKNVVKLIQDEWAKEVKVNGNNVWK
jgi:phosphate transport system substrate-binding protein